MSTRICPACKGQKECQGAEHAKCTATAHRSGPASSNCRSNQQEIHTWDSSAWLVLAKVRAPGELHAQSLAAVHGRDWEAYASGANAACRQARPKARRTWLSTSHAPHRGVLVCGATAAQAACQANASPSGSSRTLVTAIRRFELAVAQVGLDAGDAAWEPAPSPAVTSPTRCIAQGVVAAQACAGMGTAAMEPGAPACVIVLVRCRGVSLAPGMEGPAALTSPPVSASLSPLDPSSSALCSPQVANPAALVMFRPKGKQPPLSGQKPLPQGGSRNGP